MLQVEQEVNGSDYSMTFKTMNPNPLELTGLYMASYLQSVSQRLVVGSEIVLQRPTPDMEETAMSLVGKYTGNDYIATAQFQGVGAIQASYYQRINEKVDFGVELNLMVQGGRREAVATVGGKFDFRQATFRGQIDTTGRVSAVLEEKMAPGFSFLISGDLDHMKVSRSTCRFVAKVLTHLNRAKASLVSVSCCPLRLDFNHSCIIFSINAWCCVLYIVPFLSFSHFTFHLSTCVQNQNQKKPSKAYYSFFFFILNKLNIHTELSFSWCFIRTKI